MGREESKLIEVIERVTRLEVKMDDVVNSLNDLYHLVEKLEKCVLEQKVKFTLVWKILLTVPVLLSIILSIVNILKAFNLL